tara:strand:+ start:15 stop:743 length:729 start_codon:yes stop_codon:yes gene_type:complete
MTHLKNFLYSLYCGASFLFIYFYIFNIFFGRKVFRKYSPHKKNFENEIDKLKSQKILIGMEMQIINYNIPHIVKVLSDENFLDKKIDCLIIGCYEGHSTLFFLMTCIHAKFTCVDIWNKNNYHKRYNRDAESYFDKNIENFKQKVFKVKNDSQSFLNKNSKKYDLIYIDGSHDASIVEQDCKKSFDFLNINGVLIVNSLFWRGFKKIKNNNLSGVVNFMKKIKNFKIIYVTRSILILKKYKD